MSVSNPSPVAAELQVMRNLKRAISAARLRRQGLGSALACLFRLLIAGAGLECRRSLLFVDRPRAVPVMDDHLVLIGYGRTVHDCRRASHGDARTGFRLIKDDLNGAELVLIKHDR